MKRLPKRYLLFFAERPFPAHNNTVNAVFLSHSLGAGQTKETANVLSHWGFQEGVNNGGPGIGDVAQVIAAAADPDQAALGVLFSDLAKTASGPAVCAGRIVQVGERIAV